MEPPELWSSEKSCPKTTAPIDGFEEAGEEEKVVDESALSSYELFLVSKSVSNYFTAEVTTERHSTTWWNFIFLKQKLSAFDKKVNYNVVQKTCNGNE